MVNPTIDGLMRRLTGGMKRQGLSQRYTKEWDELLFVKAA